MNSEQLTKRLEAAWDVDGFLGRLRGGEFDLLLAADFLQLLRTVDLSQDAVLQKRLVALMWYIPSFLTWQRIRVIQTGGDSDKYDKFVTSVHNALEDILGVP